MSSTNYNNIMRGQPTSSSLSSRATNGNDKRRNDNAIIDVTNGRSSYNANNSNNKNNTNNNNKTPMTSNASNDDVNPNDSSSFTTNNHIHNNNITLSRLEMEDIQYAFDIFDTERCGKVSLLELRSVINEMCHEAAPTASSKSNSNATNNNNSSTGFQRVLKSIQLYLDQNSEQRNENSNNNDNNNDDGNMVSFDEFLQIVINTPHSMNDDDDDELRKVFDLFDTDLKGYITVTDLQNIAYNDLGETSITHDELLEMISVGSTLYPLSNDSNNNNDNNVVTYEQFQQIMNQKLFS